MNNRPDLASAMFPNLSRETKQRESAEQKWEAERQRRKQQLVANLREVNQKIDARMRRERRP